MAANELNQVLNDALTGEHAYTQNLWEEIQAFYHAVSWDKDRWIFGIFAYEAVVFLTVLLCRRQWEILSVIFGCNALLLFFMERLNTFLHQHWQSFSTQQYFDEHGAFLITVLGVPLLVCELVIVIFLVSEAVRIMVKVKSMQLKRELAAKAKAEKKEK
mmetsp:Transcript_2958/g.6478  ORF Transcript_2958/g.6478 Transcript_2958/m.6478 type:complete len:159 (+) Transcript_2958:104-580(+)